MVAVVVELHYEALVVELPDNHRVVDIVVVLVDNLVFQVYQHHSQLD